jgi:hypothetical protein
MWDMNERDPHSHELLRIRLSRGSYNSIVRLVVACV